MAGERQLQQGNHLLATLPDQEFRRWLLHLETVAMPRGQVLCESGRGLNHIYFPATSILSLLYQLENGTTSEVASIGNEGAVGISLFMGGRSMPCDAIAETSDWGFRIHARVMLDAFQEARCVTT
jgi:CRP-like cAMP-binding protein